MAEMGINIITFIEFSNDIDDITLSEIMRGGGKSRVHYREG